MNRKSNHKLLILFLHIIFANTFMLQAQINTNLPVGAIPGAIDVSPMGAATYTIPIEVVPGTQGMQPNLSIVYNSFGGMGLLGMKWNLAGLSAITRCGQTPYYDYNISTIGFGRIANTIALDGERLIKTATINADGVFSEFATEVENFTRVYAHGTFINGGPNQTTHFKAYTEDGTIIEYGNTSDSRQNLSPNVVLSWYINKITDVNGNYMTFQYGGQNTGEIWIEEIQYTGNTGLTPYAKVQFSYKNLPEKLGSNTYFVGGYAIPQTKLLETVTVQYGSSTVRQYKFVYNTEDSGEHTTHLKEVLLFGGNGLQQCNSTKIIWGANTVNLTSKPVIGLAHGKILTGDFNGDGFTDILVYETVSTNKGWKMYLYDPSKKEYPQYPSYINTTMEYATNMIYAQDINSDGKDEIIVGKKVTGTDCSYNFYIYRISDGFQNVYGSKYIYNFYSIYFGDFDGDGRTDMAFLTFDENGGWLNKKFTWYLEFYSGTQLPNYMNSIELTTTTTFKAPKIKVLDLNGNGKKNIEVHIYPTTFIYEFSDSGFNTIYEGSPLLGAQHLFYGDVNGDGITDVMEWTWKENTIGFGWYMYLSKGNISLTPFQKINGLNDNWWINYSPGYKPMFVDMNGDGKEDIIQGVYSSSTGKTTFTVLLSKGYVGDEFKYAAPKTVSVNGQYTLLENCHIGDFTGTGNLGILLKDTAYSNDIPKIIFLERNPDYEFVKEITDGMDKKIQINYKHKYHISDNYPFYDYQKMFLSLVETVKISNGLNTSLNTLQYQFISPSFSPKRKTFLGFKEFVCTNVAENSKEHQFVDILFSKNVLKLKEQKSYVGTTQTGHVQYTYNVKELPKNRFAPYFSSILTNDLLTGSSVYTNNTLDNDGRLFQVVSKTKNCENCNLLHIETKTFAYQTITIDGNQKKTAPTQVLTIQQYGATGVVIADTISYGYYSATDKGRLKWMRQGNLDGCITTDYKYYEPTGVCSQKTVSAAGCAPRTEKYSYDATRRFVTTITNALNHSAYLDFNAKTGQKLWEIDANMLVTSYSYDKYNRLTKINHSDGTITKDSIYWFSGSTPSHAKYCTKTTSSGKPDLIVYYDILGREVCRLDDGNYYDTRYNNKGQVTQTSYPYTNLSDPDNSKDWSKFEYDNFGRKSKEIAPFCSLSYSYNFRKVKVTDHLHDNIQSWKDYDALGRITQAQDPGGIINYNYTVNLNKRHITTIESNGATTTIETDLWGNRLKLTEPNAGTVTSEYTKFNELKKQTDANGNITLYTYDLLGRVTTENFTSDPNHMPYPPSVVYTYDTGNKALGKISTIEMAGYVSEQFTYDNFGRVATHTKHTGVANTFRYSYNENGQLQQLKYPGGNFAVDYNYTTAGKLKEIRRSSDSSLIYEVKDRNKYQQPTKVAYGNNRRIPINTDYTYNDFGMVTGIKTTAGMQSTGGGGSGGTFDDRGNGVVMNYVYGYNEKGLMTSRADNTVNQNESYVYDDLDRLTKNTYYDCSGNNIVQTFIYQPNGNIFFNSQVGKYNYDPVKKHAVTQIECPNPDLISQNKCSVVYNRFNQPTQITESDRMLTRQIELSYGANRQRNKAVFKENDSIIDTRHYINKYYERGRDSLGKTLYYHYIYGDGGVVALHIGNRNINLEDSTALFDTGGIDQPNDRGVDTIDVIYYIHTDHLGSYCALTDIKGNVVQRNCFDPWGNNIGTVNYSLTKRGFTGHEHYPELRIINMNGRLYDPVIARFFSPDKYVANSSFTQDFNRYSYARNNPLMYTDPDGEFAFLAPLIVGITMGAMMGACQGAMIASQKGVEGGTFALYMLGGALIGGVIGGASGVAGAALSSAIGLGGIVGGAVCGAIMGVPTGAVNGLAMGLLAGLKGDDLGKAVGTGAWMGGVTGFVGGAIFGGIQAAIDGKNIWVGDYLSLKDKFAILEPSLAKEGMDKLGDGSLKKVFMADRKNTARFDGKFRVWAGKIRGPEGVGDGFMSRGNFNGFTNDGYATYANNEIYLSRSAVRGIWKGYNKSIGTFFHEYQHAVDAYSGEMSRIQSTHPDPIRMLEFRAHNAANSLYPSPWRRYQVNDYFYKLKLVGTPIP